MPMPFTAKGLPLSFTCTAAAKLAAAGMVDGGSVLKLESNLSGLVRNRRTEGSSRKWSCAGSPLVGGCSRGDVGNHAGADCSAVGQRRLGLSRAAVATERGQLDTRTDDVAGDSIGWATRPSQSSSDRSCVYCGDDIVGAAVTPPSMPPPRHLRTPGLLTTPWRTIRCCPPPCCWSWSACHSC